MPKILVVGSSNIDMVVQTERLPRLGETVLGGSYMTVSGGKGANQAVAVARAGGDVAFFGRLGTDGFGEECMRSLSRDNIDVSRVLRDPDAPTGIALITVDTEGRNTITVAPGANAYLSIRDLDAIKDLFGEAKILLVQLEIPLDTVHRAIHMAKMAGMTVILNPAPARRLPRELLRLVDVLTPNEHEVMTLAGKETSGPDSCAKAAAALLEEGVKSVVVTMGSEGALLVDESGSRKIAGRKVRALDTTAAGDVFAGCLATALSEGQSLAEAIPFANAAAALCVTRLGAQASIPARREIEDFLSSSQRQASLETTETQISPEKIEELRLRARNIRRSLIEVAYSAGIGSVAGSLSAADLLTVLYFHTLIFNPRDPRWQHRDRVVFSKAHCAPVLYAALSEAGILDPALLKRYAKMGSLLQGLPDSRRTPGVDATCTSAGQGLSVANGMAIASKISRAGYRIYALLGDGEMEEGQVWEAAMTSVAQRLDNLVVLLDHNGTEEDPETGQTPKGSGSVASRWESFGWRVLLVDGHDFESLVEALESAKDAEGRPTVIIAFTVKGKGVSFLERKPDTLGMSLAPDEFDLSMEELAG